MTTSDRRSLSASLPKRTVSGTWTLQETASPRLEEPAAALLNATILLEQLAEATDSAVPEDASRALSARQWRLQEDHLAYARRLSGHFLVDSSSFDRSAFNFRDLQPAQGPFAVEAVSRFLTLGVLRAEDWPSRVPLPQGGVRSAIERLAADMRRETERCVEIVLVSPRQLRSYLTGNVTWVAASPTTFLVLFERRLAAALSDGLLRPGDVASFSFQFRAMCLAMGRAMSTGPMTVTLSTGKPGWSNAEAQGRKAQLVSGVTITIGSIVAGPSMANQGARSAFVLGLRSCIPDDQTALQLTQNAFGLGIGSTPISAFVGSLVFNPLAVLIVALLQNIIACGLTVWHDASTASCRARVRFPGLLGIPANLLIDPTMGAVVIAFAYGEPYEQTIAVASAALCVASVGFLAFNLRFRFHAQEVDPNFKRSNGARTQSESPSPGQQRPQSELRWTDKFVMEDNAAGDHTEEPFHAKTFNADSGPRPTSASLCKVASPGYCHRWGKCFVEYRAPYGWFFAAEYGFAGFIGLLDGMKLGSGRCAGVGIAYVVALMIYFAAMIAFRPHRSLGDVIFVCLLTAVQIAAAIAYCVGHYTKNDQAYDVSANLATVALYATVVKSIFDVLRYVFRRRSVALAWWLSQQRKFGASDKLLALEDEMLRNDMTAELALRTAEEEERRRRLSAMFLPTLSEPPVIEDHDAEESPLGRLEALIDRAPPAQPILPHSVEQLPRDDPLARMIRRAMLTEEPATSEVDPLERILIAPPPREIVL